MKVDIRRAPEGYVPQFVHYLVHENELGRFLFVFNTSNGRLVKLLPVADEDECNKELDKLKQEFAGVVLVPAPESARELARRAFETSEEPIAVELYGTDFQVKVLSALATLGEGEIVTYSELAERAGCPRAVRAVASAVGRNPICELLPCHQVLPKDARQGIGNYSAGGPEMKKKLLRREMSKNPGKFNNFIRGLLK